MRTADVGARQPLICQLRTRSRVHGNKRPAIEFFSRNFGWHDVPPPRCIMQVPTRRLLSTRRAGALMNAEQWTGAPNYRSGSSQR